MNTPSSSKYKVSMYFERILDFFHDGIYISDCHGETIMVNAPWERLTGIPASQVIGRNVRELLKKGFFTTIVNPKVVDKRSTVTAVQEVNGRKVVLHGHPVLDPEGEVALVVTFVRDVTAFERLKEEIAFQKGLIDYYQRQVSSLNPEEAFQHDGMVAVSSASRRLLDNVNNIAPSDATVLILGETGVGKDMVARLIHQKSARRDAAFVKVDCAAIPENLVESELLGYVSGAFSGARAKGKKGYFEKANRGTIFLDEIGELSLPMQTKLLRAIQDQEIVRVGSTKVIPIDVRIIAATNRNLEKEVEKGNFRSDLFYRLKVAVIKIESLKDRKDDILPLINIFLKRFNQKYNKNVSLTSRAENMLLNYSWPGNVRELENMIHSIVVTSSKPRITCKELNIKHSLGQNSCRQGSLSQYYDIGNRSLREIVQSFESDLINEAMNIYGSVSKVAKILQVDRSTIFRKTRMQSRPPRRKAASRTRSKQAS